MTLKTKFGLGLAALGRPEYINIRTDSTVDKTEKAFKENAFSVLDEAYKHGIRYFDTAPSYGKGEAFLNQWQKLNKFSDTILGTKWGYTYVANWELGFKGKHEVKTHTLNKLDEQWAISKNMIPNLEYYQVHSATFESGVLENTAVLNKLHTIKKETGLKIGITTSGTNQSEVIEAALKITIADEYLFDSFQVTYNVFDQSSFSVLTKVLQQGKKVIIKEALANGRVFKNEKFDCYNEAYQVLETIAKKYKVGADAIALRFVIDNLKPSYLLSGASNKTQLKENLKALEFNLTRKELELIKTLKITPDAYWNERNTLNWN